MKKIFILIIFFVLFYQIDTHAQCQDITANITSTTPAADPDGVLRICQGQTVTFVGSATFASFSAGSTYDWVINNVGGYASTSTFVHTFSTPGVYIIDFVPQDSTGCKSKDCDSRIAVHVSGKPSFAGTNIPDSFCVGTTVSLGGSATPGAITGVSISDTFSYDCAPPISDTTFLPDGSGVSYTTSIDVTCYTACDTIQDGTDINGICLNIEHSYIGDLQIEISCPSGETVVLKQYPGGGGTFLGAANDDGSLTPGVGWDYCFTDNTTNPTMLNAITAGGYTVPAGAPILGTALIAGDYAPFQSLDGLIGCPLNGEWTITVHDNLFIDNGYIFGWHIDFNVATTTTHSFSNTYPSQAWTGPGITPPSGNPTIVTPPSVGPACYQFTVIDNFNCTYDTTICAYVKPFPNPGSDTMITICDNMGLVSLYGYLAGTPEIGGYWTGTGVSSTGILNPLSVTPGTYVYTYTVNNTFCDSSATITVNIVSGVNIDYDFTINKGCIEDTVHFTNLTTDSLVYWRWNFDDGSAQDSINQNPMHIYSPQDEYGVWFVVKNSLGCVDSLLKIVDTRHPLNALFTQSSDSICQHSANNVAFFDGSVGNVVTWDWDFGDGGTSTIQNPTHVYTTAGNHTVRLVITDDVPCTDTFYRVIFVDSTPSIKVEVDRDSICIGEQIIATADYSFNAQNVIWNFNDGLKFESMTKSQKHNYTVPGTYLVQVTSEHLICPDITAQDTVTVKPYPQINLGNDTAICLSGAPFDLNIGAIANNNPPGTIYYWSNNDTATDLKVVHPGEYRVYADLDGCITTDAITILKDCYIDIPNAFSPNGDGHNDYFLPRQFLSEGVIDFKLVIYNRWGEIIYETSNADGRGWDGKFGGKDQPEGVYVYQITTRYKNQNSEKYSGNVTLLR